MYVLPDEPKKIVKPSPNSLGRVYVWSLALSV